MMYTTLCDGVMLNKWLCRTGIPKLEAGNLFLNGTLHMVYKAKGPRPEGGHFVSLELRKSGTPQYLLFTNKKTDN